MRKVIISVYIFLLMIQAVTADVVTSSVHTVRWDLSTSGIGTSFNIYIKTPDSSDTSYFKRIGNAFDAGADFTIGYVVTSLQNNIRISLTTSGPLTSTTTTAGTEVQTLPWSMVVLRDNGQEDEVISEEESGIEQTRTVYQHKPTEGITGKGEYELRIITKDYITRPEDTYSMSVTLGIEVR